MEIRLQIDDGKWTEAFPELLTSLSQEQKEAILSDVLREWLIQKSPTAERTAYAEKLWAAAGGEDNKNLDYWKKEEIKKKILAYQTSFQKFNEEAINLLAGDMREAIKDILKTDPLVQQAKADVVSRFRENFPAMMQQALTAHFLDLMSNTISTMQWASGNRDNLNQLLQSRPE